MPDEPKEREHTENDPDQEVLEDLDVSGGEADKVIGGRSSCPCEGGEIQR